MIPERFKLVFMSFLAIFICYIDRVNISVAIIPMQQQFGWSEAQVGIVFSSFYFGYMFTMILGGYLADKYGGKYVLGFGVLAWSLFTFLTPIFAYQGFFAIFLIRVLLGLGEGVAFPSIHSLYARWIPFTERTRVIAITNSGISAGTVFGFALTTIIITMYSWELVFYLFGLLGIIWSFFWFKGFSSMPSENKKISDYELSKILNEAPSSENAKKVPFKNLISNLPFLAITVATFCNNWVLFTFISYMPKYVNSDISIGGLGISLESDTFLILIILPAVIGVISLLIGGFIVDTLIKQGLKVIVARKLFNSIGFFGAGVLIYLIPYQTSVEITLILLCLINFCIGMAAGGFGVNHADIGPNYTGNLFGIAGSIGMIAAVFSPLAAGFILENTNSWFLIFNISTIVLFFGGLFYLFFSSANKQFD
ncbi:MAG: sodium-dependent phosphate transport protein 1, ic [SAR86 cluster bacterium SAR86B]|uniref:Sodium-dependent phosphate transport protein 1, ic n=1 Tax=SAR86 cluster bacterium SAR86B TaxID=1123867 RepID=J4V2W0_9GAMM|nr:MAG: sodium-dependent phosphate transport protein 1, ic [SAR86 cluster bacterium SAR86B]